MVSIERKCIASRWKYLVDHLPAEDVLDCLIEKGNCSIDDIDHLAKMVHQRIKPGENNQLLRVSQS